jgi:N-acetylglucosaminyldiphosphoundecaprenol N-acetyl-beta-D-mannosaminyltransferase
METFQQKAPENARKAPQDVDTVRVLGIRMARVTRHAFVETLINCAHGGTPLLVTYLNAHTVNVYFSDPEYARIIDRANIVYADGQAVVWASRFLGDPLPERVSAADFFVSFCQRCADEGLSLFLLGSRPGVAEGAQRKLQDRVKGLRIVGTQHGHFQRADNAAVVERIRAARPDVLIIGMGVPRQEKWTAENLERLGVPVGWCVGALFEYVSGTRRHAPHWMRRAGLEWLFRLVQEPGRLWQRYLIGNLQFVIRVLRHKIAPKKTLRDHI